MKILLASDTFMPMVNGVVASTLTLYKELKNLGHDVKILALSDNGKEKVIGDFYYLKSFKINVYPDARANVSIKNNILHDILEWNPDIVHTQTEFTVLLAAKRIVTKCNAVHIHTYHTMYEDYTNFLIRSKRVNKTVVGNISKHFLNSIDGVIAPTSKTYNALERYGVDSPIKIIPTGIDLSRFNQNVTEAEILELKEKYNIDTNKKVIVYLGRVSEEKNVTEILDYIAKDTNYFKDKIFFVAGGGPYLDELKKIASERNVLEYIRFSGMIKPKETYKFYKIGDVFCTASTSETQGLTYMESLASGVPVICRYDDCIKDVVINDKTGYTYTNYFEFKEYINNILYNVDIMSKLKSNGLELSIKYSSETFGKDMESFYKETLFRKNAEIHNESQHQFKNIVLKHIRKS